MSKVAGPDLKKYVEDIDCFFYTSLANMHSAGTWTRSYLVCNITGAHFALF